MADSYLEKNILTALVKLVNFIGLEKGERELWTSGHVGCAGCFLVSLDMDLYGQHP